MFDKIIDLLKPVFSWEGLVVVVILALFWWGLSRLGDWIEENS